MTSKLKCPFCQQGLLREYNRDRDTVIYRCDNCYFQGDGIIWIALIQAKQDLEIARKALKSAQDHNNRILKVLGEEVAEESTDDEECCWIENCSLKQELKQALEQIEHKE